jgi:hemerythrin-like domain-containing protein
MDAIDILINEHIYIKKVLSAIEKDCIELTEGKKVDIGFYRSAIDFVRNFADKYHHLKEEKRLFNVMSEVDTNLKGGPIMAMLLEHDLGRKYIGSLEQAINEYESGKTDKKAYIIANALSYVTLLRDHIDKEDTVIYMAARRILGQDILRSMSEEYVNIENDISNIRTREKYIEFANRL